MNGEVNGSCAHSVVRLMEQQTPEGHTLKWHACEHCRMGFMPLAAHNGLTAEMRAKLGAAEYALRFYADPVRYRGSNQRAEGPDPYTPTSSVYLTDVLRDNGALARSIIGNDGRAKA
ncbi:hypothetical protein UFOVP119_4 [uncultured Caudovirales phage]|uniref:Uncharacterized protein n=1 Tax=uncultured Caudovirales phage TaxID=2100421 RepID=A0A6J5LBT7_9CAUD|nr:hypothetical protein UFOVP119_4 [uncultured Caudovirales phage]